MLLKVKPNLPAFVSKESRIYFLNGNDSDKALAVEFGINYLQDNMDDQFDTKFWMRMALQEAQKGYRLGEVPVGCVIVLDGQMLGRGFNQTEKLKDPTAHAEILAITSACEAIGAGTCGVAAYHQELMDQLLGVDGEEEFAIYLAPVGKV